MPASTFTELLAGLTSEERRARKAQGLASIVNTGSFTVGNRTVNLSRLAGYSYTLHGVTITVVGAAYAGNVLTVFATARDANGALPAADENAYRFINPPLLHVTSVDDSDPNNPIVRTVEDVINVAKQWLYDSVVTYARNHGWNG